MTIVPWNAPSKRSIADMALHTIEDVTDNVISELQRKGERQRELNRLVKCLYELKRKEGDDDYRGCWRTSEQNSGDFHYTVKTFITANVNGITKLAERLEVFSAERNKNWVIFNVVTAKLARNFQFLDVDAIWNKLCLLNCVGNRYWETAYLFLPFTGKKRETVESYVIFVL